MRLVHLFTCLFCFSFSIGFGQSVYEDAKKLKEELIGLKKKDSDTKVWLKLTKTLPFVFISDHLDQDRRDSDISYGLEFSIDPMSEYKSYEDDTDYLILPKGGLSDSLIVQSLNNPDNILFTIPIRYTYYILKQNHERLDLITPNGEYIANILLYDPMYDPIFITTSKKNAIYFDAREIYPLEFADSKKTLDKFGNYIFYSIPIKDTVEISSAEGKLAILYNKGYTPNDSMCVKIINENKTYTVAPGEINIEYFANKITIYAASEYYNVNIKSIPTLTYNSYLPSEIYANVKQEAKDKKASIIQFFPDSVLIDKYYYEFILDSLHSENRKINQAILYRGEGMMKAFSFINPESFSLLNKNNGNNILLTISQRSDKVYTQEWSKKKRLLSEKTECLNLSRFFAYDFYKNELIVSIDIDTFINLQYEIDSNGILIKGVDQGTIERFKNCQNGKYKFILDVNKFKKAIDATAELINICIFPNAFFEEQTYLGVPDYEIESIKWFPAFDSTFEFEIYNEIVNFTYRSTTDKVIHEISFSGKSLFPLLAPHSHLKKSDLQTQNLWADLSARYRNNPFLTVPLKNTLAQHNYEQIPGMPDDSLRRKLAVMTATNYPWQGVMFDNDRLEADQAVSYQEKVETYRTPVVTASDNLQAASDQFGSESKKLKRGLSTADLAAGLSDFIVERAQEELNVTFLSRLREGILGDTAEFSILFPETRKMLSEFRIVQYRTLLDFAKNAFILDLRNLGVNFPKLFKLKQDKYRKIWNNPRVYNIFLLYDIANKVYENMPAETILLHIHKQLHERRIEVSKSINERLAQTIMSRPGVKDTLTRLVTNYKNRLKEFETKHNTLIKENTAKWEYLFAESLDRKANQQLLSNWKIHIKSREYTLAINNLNGDPDYAYVRDSLPFEAHQAYFAKSPDSIQVISTGIDWAGTLLSRDSILGYFGQIAAIEGRLVIMDSIKRQREAESARANRSLSAYFPIFERYRDIMMQRVCLELALAAEIHLDTVSNLKRLTEHERQALIYLQQVLKFPNKYKLYDWDRMNSFGSILMSRALDSCVVCGSNTSPFLNICNFSGKPLGENDEALKMFDILDEIEPISSEMDKAREFLDKMAMAIKAQFNEIARNTAYKNTPNISDLADTVYYNHFLFSREMTERTLAFNYEKFLLKMQEVIKADKGGGKNMPDWEVLKNDKLKQHIRNYQDAWRRNTITRDIAGNYFLDYYNQTPPFDTSLWTVKTKGTMAQLLDSTRQAITALDDISRQFHDYIDTLQNKYACDLLRSLKQTGEFSLLTQITLQWLYAFQDAPEQADSVVLRDSTLQHVVQFEPAGKEPKPDDIETEAADKKNKLSDAKTAPADKKQKPGDINTAQFDRQVSYDTIRVNKRKIGDRRWITPKKFNDMMEDTLLRRCFMGLLYQRLAAIEGGARYDARSMALLATKFMNTIYDIDDRREMLRYKKETNQPLRFEDYYPFIRSTVDMLNFVLETPFQAGGDPLIERFETLRDVPKISNEVLSLFENVFAENYPNAIHNVVQLLSITWGLDVKTTGQKPREGAAAANKIEKRQLQPKLTREDKKNIKVKSAILTYGSFMANMVGAQTPEQVKAAIRAVALPAGSSSIKRNSAFNVSVNSYLGLGGYREFLTDKTIPGDQRAGITFGLSVPVGAAFSWANRDAAFNRKKWKRLSYSVFIPVIDLGAVTAYRIDQKNVNAALPELNFGNIIAPGAYFMVNFPRSPFTLGAGWQWGPQLRKITVGNNTEITSRAWRIGLTASIDVPIFNIFTSRE